MTDANPKITIIAEGTGVDGTEVEKALTSLPDVKIKSQEPSVESAWFLL